MYTIENHLEHLSHGDDKCKTIYSIWNLNKQNLKRALSTIQINFPHYSIHDYSHADTIIQNIELYLGHERIKTLSITDSWLLLMSAYTHDIGMIVFMKNLELQLNAPGFLDELVEKSNNRYDLDLADAAKTILSLIAPDRISDKTMDSVNISAILKIKKSITLLSAELFRKIHHEQSKKIISGIDESFANEFNKFYSNDIPVRFLQILGDIAYCHGIGFYETIELLPQKSNGYASDYMHPRFIACMLRLGDLLDVDDKRFNQFSTKVFAKESNKVSNQHEKKHASVKHLLVTPESIEATIDCKKDEKVFRIANQWFDFLKKEIENQNREWSNIRPEYLTGLSPSFSKDKIIVLFNGKTADTDLMSLQFHISREKTFEIFEGSALYDNPSLVFLREVTQNAVDATKIQLWKDIEKGVYNFLIKENLKNLYGFNTGSWDTKKILENIKFPNDIPDEIYDNYDVSLEIKWENSDQRYLSIVTKDKGCGINKFNLLRMCKHVGDSRKSDILYKELKERMPFFLKPTGAFGLGLQSIFLVADEFEMDTKNEDDNGWNIIFRSARRNEYITVNPIKGKIPTGTTLKILIPEKNLETLFSNNYSVDVRDFYDEFTDEMGGRAIWSMILFAQEYLLSQKFLKLFTHDKLIAFGEYQPSRRRNEENTIIKYNKIENLNEYNEDSLATVGTFTLSRGSNYSNIKIEKMLGFKIFEKIDAKSGSEINIAILNKFPKQSYEFQHFSLFNFASLYSVRDIIIKNYQNHFLSTQYMGLNINLLNPESDKILNIARSKLIDKQRNEFNKIFFKKILPGILPQIKILFEKNIDKLSKFVDEDSLKTIYFHLKLTFLINDLPINNFNESYYDNLYLPEEIMASYKNGLKNFNKISANELFDVQGLIVSTLNSESIVEILQIKEQHYLGYNELNDHKKAYRKAAIPKYSNLLEAKPIVWFSSYLFGILNRFYKLKSFLIDDSGIFIGEELFFSKEESYNTIQLENSFRKSYYSKYLYRREHFSENRLIFHAIEPYASILAVKETHSSLLSNFPQYSDHGIISPFENRNIFKELVEELKELAVAKNENKIKEVIKAKYLDTFVNDRIIQYVIEHASIIDFERNPQVIKTTYVDLITEILLCYNQNETEDYIEIDF